MGTILIPDINGNDASLIIANLIVGSKVCVIDPATNKPVDMIVSLVDVSNPGDLVLTTVDTKDMKREDDPFGYPWKHLRQDFRAVHSREDLERIIKNKGYTIS